MRVSNADSVSPRPESQGGARASAFTPWLLVELVPPEAGIWGWGWLTKAGVTLPQQPAWDLRVSETEEGASLGLHILLR